MSPVFCLDGSSIAYTVPWDTWVVPVVAGEPKLWRKNASGLIWIGPQRLMFTEIKNAAWHMAIVTSTENRAESRDVYLPEDDQAGMAHRSYLSPDRKQVLLAEMDKTGWLPCRVVPFNGRSRGTTVGPAPSRCTEAAWSPDGKWMYFTADAGEGFHLWRQRKGSAPEQITFGPITEEEGIAVVSDGRSLITSVGTSQSAVYFHDSNGDRQVSVEGHAVQPSLSATGKKLYYLASTLSTGGPQRRRGGGELYRADLESTNTERLLPGVFMRRISVVFVPRGTDGDARGDRGGSTARWRHAAATAAGRHPEARGADGDPRRALDPVRRCGAGSRPVGLRVFQDQRATQPLPHAAAVKNSGQKV